MSSGLSASGEYRERLLVALAHDLRLPLLQIASGVEVLQTVSAKTKLSHTSLQQLSAVSKSGIELIDSYLLALQIANNNQQLVLEPVAVGAILDEAAHRLTPYARQYDTTLSVHVSSRPKPVLAHRPSMEALFVCLGSSLIRAQVAQRGGLEKKHQIQFGAHGNRSDWITAGVFGSIEGLTYEALRTARNLVGKARQPLPALAADTAAGVLLADLLSSMVYHPLKSATHGHQKGLATSFPVSKQLRLV